MNRTVLTPCRKVGLSRKKSTPKSIENLLNINNSYFPSAKPTTPDHHQRERNIILKESQKDEQNCETPCRQVGLSRRRKGTPINEKKNMNKPFHTPLSLQRLSEAKLQDKKPDLVMPKIECSKDIFEKLSCQNAVENYYKNDTRNYNNEASSMKLMKQTDDCNLENELLDTPNNVNLDLNLKSSHSNFDSVEKPDDYFMKMSYESKKTSEYSNKLKQLKTGSKKNKCSQLTQFNYEILNDDDFIVDPRRKSKKMFERSLTDFIANDSRNRASITCNKTLKKSLTDASIPNYNVGECFVKLNCENLKTKKSNMKNSKSITSYELSDDDFEAPILTPPENTRLIVNNLVSEVEQKKKLLDELKRAKLYFVDFKSRQSNYILLELKCTQSVDWKLDAM